MRQSHFRGPVRIPLPLLQSGTTHKAPVLWRKEQDGKGVYGAQDLVVDMAVLRQDPSNALKIT
jgi:hypothetical protein